MNDSHKQGMIAAAITQYSRFGSVDWYAAEVDEQEVE